MNRFAALACGRMGRPSPATSQIRTNYRIFALGYDYRSPSKSAPWSARTLLRGIVERHRGPLDVAKYGRGIVQMRACGHSREHITETENSPGRDAFAG